MNEEHASTLQLVKELHALGATQVRVGDVEVRFDRVMVPLARLERSSETEQVLADELEGLRDFRRRIESLGVV